MNERETTENKKWVNLLKKPQKPDVFIRVFKPCSERLFVVQLISWVISVFELFFKYR